MRTLQCEFASIQSMIYFLGCRGVAGFPSAQACSWQPGSKLTAQSRLCCAVAVLCAVQGTCEWSEVQKAVDGWGSGKVPCRQRLEVPFLGPPEPPGGAAHTWQGSLTREQRLFLFLVYFGLNFHVHIYCLKTKYIMFYFTMCCSIPTKFPWVLVHNGLVKAVWTADCCHLISSRVTEQNGPLIYVGILGSIS